MKISNPETAVKQRYAHAAQATERALCCPVDYDRKYLEIIPAEVIEKDYGCGDPTRYLKPGETVLDLGSGTGKICFIAAQVVGPGGRIIGVDMTDDMLEVARRNAAIVAQRLGYSNVEFRKGRIQDLALDLELLERELKARPITDANAFLAADERAQELRARSPMIPDDSVDVVVSNCVLNLVQPSAKRQLFAEIFRAVRQGGRVVISDIVSDEAVPAELQNDPTLWSGCISGAYREDLFLKAFEDAGFYGLRIVKRDEQPWQTVRGIEFRSLTVEAFKGTPGPDSERHQAVIYRGPFKEVIDDEGRRMERGKRYAVSDKTFQLYRQSPYQEQFELIAPRNEIPPEQAKPFEAKSGALRHPRESKGLDFQATTEAGECCGGGNCC